jgi:osmotically-inducible protein OsmY
VFTSALAFGLWAAIAGAAAPAQAGESPLGARVSQAVGDCPHLTIFDHVVPVVRGDIVMLTGKVTTSFKREAVERRVAAVTRDGHVRSEIAVLPQLASDEDLRQRIARAIYGNASFWHYAVMPRPPIHIIVEHGNVTLTGTVRTDQDRLLARALAVQEGAASVANALKTDREVLATLEPRD